MLPSVPNHNTVAVPEVNVGEIAVAGVVAVGPLPSETAEDAEIIP